MNADLEAALAEGKRRMKQFEDKTSHQIDMFDREVEQRHQKLGYKYSSITEDLKPVSYPLWGVVLENSSGHRVYSEHLPVGTSVTKYRRFCDPGTSSFTVPQSPKSISSMYELPPMETSTNFESSFIPSPASQAIMEGRRWGINKYLYDEEYVSNPPYGVIMKKPTPKPPLIVEDEGPRGEMERVQPNTKLVSKYWRRKWKIPDNW